MVTYNVVKRTHTKEADPRFWNGFRHTHKDEVLSEGIPRRTANLHLLAANHEFANEVDVEIFLVKV